MCPDELGSYRTVRAPLKHCCTYQMPPSTSILLVLAHPTTSNIAPVRPAAKVGAASTNQEAGSKVKRHAGRMVHNDSGEGSAARCTVHAPLLWFIASCGWARCTISALRNQSSHQWCSGAAHQMLQRDIIIALHDRCLSLFAVSQRRQAARPRRPSALYGPIR